PLLLSRHPSPTRRSSDLHLLVPLIGRLFGTADTRESELDRRVLSVRLTAWCARRVLHLVPAQGRGKYTAAVDAAEAWADNPTKRSEEHTSELQSRENLVC